METLKEKVELASGNAFIDWFNNKYRTNYSYHGRAGEAPDLIYSDNKSELTIEHTGAYYDSSHASFIWKGARSTEEITEPWIGCNPDDNLAKEIRNRIEEKSIKDYGKNCILLIEVPPGVTAAEDLEKRLLTLPTLQGGERFLGIYVAGRFPITSNSSGGYRVIAIKEAANQANPADAKKRRG